MTKTALVLAGHGSHISPNTAGIVWEQVDHLRALNVADEVTAAFWKETPSFHQALDTLAADDVTIVPLFTAQGYFTRTVIPAEMGLSGAITQREGRTIRYAATLSEHPALAQIVRGRIQAALAQSDAKPADVAIAIIGHGTERNPESRHAAIVQAELARDLADESIAVFLDDSPSIADIYRLTTRPIIIAVPFFLALGSHTTIDVPRELGLEPGSVFGEVSGRQIYYTDPVGVGGDLSGLILELARAADAPLREPSSAPKWDGFPSVGREALTEAVRSAGWIEFGQLTLSLHEVRPTDMDIEAEIVELSDPAALRDHLRREPFRPLATSNDLPRDWVVRIEKRAQIHAVVETIYPGVVSDWFRAKNLKLAPLSSLSARQTGMYRKIDQLSREEQARVIEQVCSSCIRHESWYDGNLEPIPCAEACNWWMSRALETETS